MQLDSNFLRYWIRYIRVLNSTEPVHRLHNGYHDAKVSQKGLFVGEPFHYF